MAAGNLVDLSTASVDTRCISMWTTSFRHDAAGTCVVLVRNAPLFVRGRRDIHSECGYALHKHVDNSVRALHDAHLRCTDQCVPTHGAGRLR